MLYEALVLLLLPLVFSVVRLTWGTGTTVSETLPLSGQDRLRKGVGRSWPGEEAEEGAN